MKRRFTKADVIAALLIAVFLPLYYKVRYLLDGFLAWDDLLAPGVWIEFLFSGLIGFSLVTVHATFETPTRLSFFILSVISAAAAAAFTLFFFTAVFPLGVQNGFVFDIALLSLATPLIISGVRDRLLLEGRLAATERAALEARFEALKSRLSPHFLFNSLSTLTEIINEDPKLAIEFVERMADIYRYIVEHEARSHIGLREELDAAKALVFVLNTRRSDALNVTWLAEEQAADFAIAPLTVQSLFENAIKHNRYSAADPLEITMGIDDRDLVVQNTFNPAFGRPSLGTGLKSLGERLQILTGRPLQFGVAGNRFWVRAPLLPATS
ncbi:MAG: histidine kinase [Pseudomonadota bacterium]